MQDFQDFQDLINRLRVVRANITDDDINKIAVDTELDAIIQQLETEHTRQQDVLRGQQEELDSIRQLEALVEQFETAVQETGGWRYCNPALAARLQCCVDHYTSMAADAVADAHSFRDSMVTWLRAIAITAQAVSWASTHHEKDARLRGMIEVIEKAINEVNKLRFDDRISRWNGVVDTWQRSDFPTREMRRRIFDLEAEVKRLTGKAPASGAAQALDDDTF